MQNKYENKEANERTKRKKKIQFHTINEYNTDK